MLGTRMTTVDDYSTSTQDYDYNTSNYSEIPELCDIGSTHSFIKIFQSCIFALIFFIGILGNSLVLTTYILYRRLKLRSMTDVFLLNLAMADLFLLLTIPFKATYMVLGSWVFGMPLCKITCSLYAINFYSGFLFLACISIDRYVVIVMATMAHKLRNKTVVYSKRCTVLVWVASILLSLPEIIFTTVEARDGDLLCETLLTEESPSIKAWTRLAQITVGFCVPFFVMLFCYSVIIRTLLKGRRLEKHKALRVILALVLVFVVFQLPYSVVLFLKTAGLLGTSCSDWHNTLVAEYVTGSLAFIRCCLNPLLYAFVGVRFRNDVLLLLRDLRCISRARYSCYVTARAGSSKRLSFASGSAANTDTSSMF
ncbi:C-C chemokine receptor type 7 isoform X1 [Lepisosteus oculatus]|uniref:C-C chemokine receptor type 7 isoform X1 n=2 Tax=Lepisosteus oculatus TaxID=7918 RepID=UPI00073FCEB1|nr:PREDICTED: C-C chemokine receptor type 10 isoform X2 [Lepisosteus oculatus]XP_015217396.1 PREDICTED: C-C chemokine receptor type 10 isoform X2 [Lepisosteus oculatus]